MKRGEIYRADLDPVVGSEQGGIRPVLVIQNGVTKLVNIKHQDAVTKVLDMVPDFVNKFAGGHGQEVSEETVKTAWLPPASPEPGTRRHRKGPARIS